MASETMVLGPTQLLSLLFTLPASTFAFTPPYRQPYIHHSKSSKFNRFSHRKLRSIDATLHPTITHSCTLFAQKDGSSNDDNAIFYDDFADLTGGSFADDSFQIPLPDFDDDKDNIIDATTNDKDGTRILSATTSSDDLTGCTTRQFSFGSSLLLSSYVGSLGYDRVTDWQYYLQTVDDDGNIIDDEERVPVVNNVLMDPSKPSRTRSKSGSVVRVFRGEFVGKLGGLLRSNGLDNRVLIKEFSAESIELAESEKVGVGMIMSYWLQGLLGETGDTERLGQVQSGVWAQAASSRYTDTITNTPTTADDSHLQTLLTLLSKHKAPFTSVLGEMNLNNYYDDPDLDPNEWYKSLGVKPPSPGSVWLVYDYHGLTTANGYCEPLMFMREKLPPKRGVFGNIVPPPSLPPFKESARYMVQGILKQMLQAVAMAHEAGLVHNSLGRNSFLLSGVGQEKREATSPYSVVVDRLRVVLSDWGFSQTIDEALYDEEFVRRAKSFGIDVDYDPEAAEELAMAEDLHALGFVFLALLFTTLAQPATLSAPMPQTDDDTWQRLFSDVFNKDMEEFREYCSNEEVWDSVIQLLDGEDGAGWSVLGDLLLAREKVVEWSKGERDNDELLVTARGLLESPLFQMRII